MREHRPAVRLPRSAGFTLIELLVVLGILSMLIVAFAPSLFGVGKAGDEAATRARMTALVSMIEGYERVYGIYPPDDCSTLGRRQEDWNLGNDNGKNTGIESLVMHLSWDPKAGGQLDAHEDWLGNTDGDNAPEAIPLLGRTAKVEVLDAWGMPLVYFSARSGRGYAGAETVAGPLVDGNAGPDQTVKPVANPRSGGFLGPRTYQLISAGFDGRFGTDDDLTHPEQVDG